MLTIPATVETFVNWLEDFTATVYLDFFPLSQGGCTLQPIRRVEMSKTTSVDSASGVVILVMDAFYWDGDIARSGVIHPHPEAVHFELQSSGAEQIALTITFPFSPIRRYRNDLLIGLLLHWPTISSQLAKLDDLDATEDAPSASVWEWPSLT